MTKRVRTGALAILTWGLVWALLAPASWAAAEEGEELDVNYLLIGHAADGFYIDFEPFGKIELPRIFLVEDEAGRWSLDVYGSSAAAVRSGDYTVAYDEEGPGDEGTGADVPSHAAGIDTETPAGTLQDSEIIIRDGLHLKGHLEATGGRHVVLDLSITRHYVFGLLAALLVLAIFIPLARRYKRGIGREKAPQGVFQNMFETLVVFVRDEIAKPNLGDQYARFLPFLLTAFFFILFCNLFGLVPYGAAATSNILVTGVLAFFTFIIGQIYASKDHWRHIFWPPGVPIPVKIILIPVEFLGLFTKHVALAIRLFANMTAGTLVILSLLALIFIVDSIFGTVAGWITSPFSVLLTLFISLVKLLVAFIQAYVFTMLSALFIGMAVEEHHGEEHAAAVEGPTPELHEDHGVVTPHTLTGDDGDLRQRTRVQQPVAAG